MRKQKRLCREEPICEESETLKPVKAPWQPTTAEMEDHRVTHIPYRSWCEHCVRGRALGQKHLRGTPVSRVPVIGVDYFFMTKDTLMTPEECRAALKGGMEDAIEKGEIVKCLMVRCSVSRSELAIVIGKKGVDDYAVSRIVSFIQWLGHVRIVMKSDNERAIVALVREALMVLRIELDMETAGVEHSPAFDSQSNGMVEVGIRHTRGLFRTLRSCLQKRLGKIIELDHPIISWLLEHVSTSRNALVRGGDGLTPWQITKGRSFAMNPVGFRRPPTRKDVAT